MAELFDTHCHLTCPELLTQVGAVIEQALAAGVTRILNVACSPGEWASAVELAEHYPGKIWLAAGIHPHEAAKVTPADLEGLARMLARPDVLAAGETGLDFHYDFSPRDVQGEVFRAQLRLAAAASRPVIIHAREAHQEVVDMLVEEGFTGRPVVFHCYSGDAAQAEELRGRGWRVSFTGIITYKNAAAQLQAAVAAPLGEVMFETDAPYLSPHPLRKVFPNVPAHLVHTVEFAAKARGQSSDELAAASTRNAMSFFAIPK